MIKRCLEIIWEWITAILMALVIFGIIHVSVFINELDCLEKGKINNIQMEYILGHGCFVVDNSFKYNYNDYMKAKAYKDNGILINE